MHTKIDLVSIGYNGFFEQGLKTLMLTDCFPARVIAEYKQAYRVISSKGILLAKITGKQMFSAASREDYPAVGDWVAISELPDNKAAIHGILPRKTVLMKKYSGRQDNQLIAANIDTAFIIESMDRDYNLNRLERYIVLSNKGNIQPVIILNKVDLIPKDELESKIRQVKNRFDNIKIITTSTVTNQGINDLSTHIIKGSTYCFLGSSGVGKSTLINKLLGKDKIKTSEINLYSERGRHTTTTREMYFLENGGIVIDNPGTREVGIADSDSGLEKVFSDIGELSKNCKFSNCTHTHEPNCAILKAVEQEKFDDDKYQNYIKLKKESDFYKMNDLEKKRKDRKFGQFIKKFHDAQKKNSG